MTRLQALTEPRLMQQISIGDTGAFEEIYRRHGHAALVLARRLGAPPELAEEVVQEAFVSLWRRADQYRPARGSVSAWLATIVRNRLTDAWRRAGARPAQVAEDAVPESAAAAADLSAADRIAVRQVVAGLPADQRDAIVLSYYGGLTHEQISATSGAPLGTVKGRVRLGLEKLRFSMAA